MWIFSFAALLLISVALLFIHHYGLWLDIFQWVANHAAVQLAYWLIPFILLYVCVSYLLMRRATI
ncbi:hypothetical protein ACI2OX_02700 [Bacillus sp. N9]